MDKCFPNLMIQNLEVLRDLSHVFNLNNIAYDRDVKVGLWQENPNHSYTHLSLWTNDFQVIFHGDGVMDIVPYKLEYGKNIYADKKVHTYDTHSWYTFGNLIYTMFGGDLANKYDSILMDDERWHPQNTKK